MEKLLQPLLSSYQRLRRDTRGFSHALNRGILGTSRKKNLVYKMLDRKLMRSRRTVTHLFGPTQINNRSGPTVLIKKALQKLLNLRR